MRATTIDPRISSEELVAHGCRELLVELNELIADVVSPGELKDLAEALQALAAVAAGGVPPSQ